MVARASLRTRICRNRPRRTRPGCANRCCRISCRTLCPRENKRSGRLRDVAGGIESREVVHAVPTGEEAAAAVAGLDFISKPLKSLVPARRPCFSFPRLFPRRLLARLLPLRVFSSTRSRGSHAAFRLVPWILPVSAYAWVPAAESRGGVSLGRASPDAVTSRVGPCSLCDLVPVVWFSVRFGRVVCLLASRRIAQSCDLRRSR